MSTFTPESKNSASWTLPSRSGTGDVRGGQPIGLLLALTYGATPDNVWTESTKSSTSWNNQAKS